MRLLRSGFWRRRSVRYVPLALLAILALSSVALGFWSGAGEHGQGNGTARTATISAGATPTVEEAGSANVVVTWGASSLTNGIPVTGYLVKRYALGGNTPVTPGSACAGTVTATTCTESATPVGDWQYTVTPVFAANWRGAESPKSGAIGTGPGSMTLSREIVGGTVAPLPATVTGTLAGFGALALITYKFDGITRVGQLPLSASLSGTATFSFTIPAGTSDGPHTIEASSLGADATVGILVDNTAPSINALLTPAPNAAGWNNTSPVEVNGTVDDGTGSGVAYAKYTNDGSDPRTSPTAIIPTGPVSVATTTTLKFYVVDAVGNASAVQTLPVKIDTANPLFSVAFANVTGGAYQEPRNVVTGVPGVAYYRGATAGSLRFLVTPVAPVGSPIVGAGFSAMPADAVGFTFDSSSVTTPAGGPFLSNVLSWAAGTTSTPAGTITLSDLAGNTFGGPGALHNDSTAPTGGFVDATGLGGSDGRYTSSVTLDVGFAKGADDGSGLADGSGPSDVAAKLQRASATLSSSDGIVNGSCGTYSAYAQLGADGAASPVADVVPTDNRCYRYRYLVSDHVGNIATYTSPDVKVQGTPPASLAPTTATLTPSTGVAAQFVSGATVYYNPALLGSFNVDASASAPYTGVQLMTFPAISGFTGGGAVSTVLSGTTFRTTYAWSANAASPSPGQQSLSATNHAGQSLSTANAFSVVKDDVGPSGGSVDAGSLGGTGGRYSTSTTLSIALARGTDPGAGLAATGAQLLRASAALTSSGSANGACGSFGAYTQVGAGDPATPKSDTVPVDRTCYRYHYVVADKVGNQTTYSSADVKVDATPPPAPALSFSALSNAYWSGTGTTIYYRPGAGSGGFRVTATSADATVGTSVIGFPSLPAGWSESTGGFGIRDYSWSAPGPSAPSGAQNVVATNNAGLAAATSFTATPDATAPAGGSVSYTTGYSTATTVSVSFVAATDAGSGLAAGSGVLQRASSALSNGTCVSFGAFATIATAPSSPVTNAVTTGNCYQYRYLVSDNVANQATFASAGVLKVDNVAPNVAVDDPGAFLRGTAALTVSADDGAGSGITSVKLQRSVADAAVWTDVCTDSSTPYGCSLDTTTMANNVYDLRAIATDGVGLVSTSAIETVEIDNTPPTIALTNPGATISGTITLVTSPADADSGLDHVTIQRKPALGSIWSDICVIAAAPWSCPFDSQGVSDGSYDFRATAVDAAGNATTSSVSTGRVVDNTTVSTVSIADPGQFLGGTVTLQANANAVGGIASVVIQRKPNLGGAWTDICTDTSTPYSCAFDTTTAATPDGSYDLRAVMTSTLGVQTTSAVVAARTIDNTVVRGADVQAANKAGGVLGRLEAGDTLTLTYSTAMKASTLIAGWSGVGSASLTVKLTDAANAESITLAPGLGTVAAGGNYVQKNKTVTFASTATLSSAAGGGSIVTIVLGTATGTGLRTQNAAPTMKWTPAGSATNLAGVASSTATVTESGALDRDF